MVMPRHTDGLRDALILGRVLEHRTAFRLPDSGSLDLLPRSLTLRHRITTGGFQIASTLLQLFFADEHIRLATPQIDANSIARTQQTEPTTGCSFR